MFLWPLNVIYSDKTPVYAKRFAQTTPPFAQTVQNCTLKCPAAAWLTTNVMAMLVKMTMISVTVGRLYVGLRRIGYTHSKNCRG